MDGDRSALNDATVPRRSRRDGWTPERQRDFLAALAATGSAATAAASVGMGLCGVYALRKHPDGQAFAAAWRAAVAPHGRALTTIAFARVVRGVYEVLHDTVTPHPPTTRHHNRMIKAALRDAGHPALDSPPGAASDAATIAWLCRVRPPIRPTWVRIDSAYMLNALRAPRPGTVVAIRETARRGLVERYESTWRPRRDGLATE